MRAFAALASVLSLVVVASSGCASMPQGTPGPEADALARTIETRVEKAAWDATDVISFSFRGTRAHLWDKSRGFVRMLQGDDEIYLDLWDRGGYATRAGVATDDATTRKLLDDAWAAYCNDTFWLNPLVKLFDEGTTRELIADADDGKRGLLVKYASGGVTPGDAYLWIVDDKGEPVAVRMWVSVLPAKGMKFTWDGWQTLESGARVATKHKAAMFEIVLDVAKQPAMDPDPFAKLVARREAIAAAP